MDRGSDSGIVRRRNVAHDRWRVAVNWSPHVESEDEDGDAGDENVGETEKEAEVEEEGDAVESGVVLTDCGARS